MRTCVILSGQPRFFRFGYSFIKENILIPNDIKDTFIHAWIDECDFGKPYHAAIWNLNNSDIIRKGDTQAVLDLYQPKSYIFERQKTFTPRRDYSPFPGKGDQCASIPSSMCWSLRESNRLKQIYELENNFKFDWCFRLRFDSAFQKPINLKEFDNRYLYTHNNCITNSGATPNSVTDQVGFGNSWDMDIYSDLYTYLDFLYLKDGAKYTQETLLGHHLKRNQVEIKQIDLKFGLIRGEKENNIQWIV